MKALQETNEILRNRNVDLIAKANEANGFLGNSQTNDENGASSDGMNMAKPVWPHCSYSKLHTP